MKQNRRRTKKMSVVASQTMHVFGVIVVLFAMVILNMLASSSCTQLQKTIGEKKRQLASLEKDRVRESARWDGMRTLNQMEESLLKLGLNMKYPKPVQIIYMNGAGQPLPAQNSVLMARNRTAPVAAAQYKTTTAVASAAPAVRAGTAAPTRVRKVRRVRR